MIFKYFIEDFLKYIDNSTISAMIGVSLAGLLGIPAYKEQKKLDKIFEIKNQIIDEIINLQDKINQIISFIEKPETKDKDIVKIATYIEKDIYTTQQNIETKINSYFLDKKIIEKTNDLINNIKSWREHLLKINFIFNKKAVEQETINPNKILTDSKILCKIIWQEKNILLK